VVLQAAAREQLAHTGADGTLTLALGGFLLIVGGTALYMVPRMQRRRH